MSVAYSAGTAAFATSPAGYVSGLLVPLGMAYAIYRFERSDRKAERRAQSLEERFGKIEEAQTDSNRALIVQTEALRALVGELTPVKARVGAHDDALGTLRESVAGLRAVLGMHLRTSGQPDDIPGDRLTR